MLTFLFRVVEKQSDILVTSCSERVLIKCRHQVSWVLCHNEKLTLLHFLPFSQSKQENQMILI